MAIPIHYHHVAGIPRLSWLAHVPPERTCVNVLHGSGVECHAEWLVEGVWDGEFEAGGFHRSENFFGSGLRVEGDCIHFVPSIALVDRLLACEVQGHWYVSNSLALLLSFTGAHVDPAHNYRADFRSILKGVRSYPREFRVLHPSITHFQQVFADSLVVSESGASVEPRSRAHTFDSFVAYYGHLSSVLQRLRDNAASPHRATPMRAYTTMSRGYDSTAVSVLARALGVEQCFTSNRSNNSLPLWIGGRAADDDGTPIAEILGMQPVRMDQRRPASHDNEFYFLAGTVCPPELVFDPMCEYIEHSGDLGVVFTGYHGDKVWDVDPPRKYLTDEVIRQDISGLGLTEIRLKAGFINVAVPFIGARHIAQVVNVSQSNEMGAWRLGTGYDRPIPRRIVESAGVPRELFGQRKKAVLSNSAFPMTRERRREFMAYLQTTHGASPWRVYASSKVEQFLYYAARAGQYALRWREKGGDKIKTRRVVLDRGFNLHNCRYVWATGELCRALRKTLASEPAARGMMESGEVFAHGVDNSSEEILRPAGAEGALLTEHTTSADFGGDHRW